MATHVLLHVRNGILSELEIYKDDSSKVYSTPNLSKLTIGCIPDETLKWMRVVDGDF